MSALLTRKLRATSSTKTGLDKPGEGPSKGHRGYSDGNANQDTPNSDAAAKVQSLYSLHIRTLLADAN
jgi:hypothetical protein